MAEYEACIIAIRIAVDMNIKEILVIGDSDLMIPQIQGEWTIKNVKILPYLHCVRVVCKKFTKIEFKHVPRIQNEFADALATLSSMIHHMDKNYIDPIEVEILDQHAYCFHVDEEPDDLPKPDDQGVQQESETLVVHTRASGLKEDIFTSRGS
ncbi:uncharacterized protein LOC142178118 [Nicotiana tabacum]|uniref:Uncharacterized protein LOC142178118 n=1 Tax=Nicotiana tabacum TaxID=4097 RepID=A0AC58U238_TOBAC